MSRETAVRDENRIPVLLVQGTDGLSQMAQVDADKNLKVVSVPGTDGAAIDPAGADAVSNTKNTQAVTARLAGFNGITWDRLRTAVTAVTSTFTGFLNTLPWSVYKATTTTRTDGQGGPLLSDASGNLKLTLATAIAGEDLTNDVLKVEHRYSYAYCIADTLVKTGAGFLHTVTITPTDAAATAGSIIIYDSVTEADPKIFNYSIPAASINPVTLTLDVTFSSGLYIGFTTTADVSVTVSYR